MLKQLTFYGNREYNRDMENVYEKISSRLKEIRKDSGMSQKQLGDKLSLSQDTVSLWENGKSLPNAEQIVSLCELFGVSADYLLALSDY